MFLSASVDRIQRSANDSFSRSCQVSGGSLSQYFFLFSRMQSSAPLDEIDHSRLFVQLFLSDEWNNLIVSDLPRDARHITIKTSVAVINSIQHGHREIDQATAPACRTTIKDNERTTGNFHPILVDLDLLSTQAFTAFWS
jgi:hypothetical protein